ncbi:unnamed protein product [Psylliodes chrysocephalus]|uniref:Dynactin subunit 3 n=1 Tax=Psylliodes chrysocephalus TaxID=3402493 RepID=A0A9P0GBA9_9CUCU|nr:unnamed protein product [Psylliodes chrysocephala]
MDPIAVLEKRIEALELQVFPLGDHSQISNKTQTITDLLSETQTMIKSALHCRESITSMLQHLVIINDYLNPAGDADELEVEAKRQCLLELYPELKDTVQTISTLESLLPFIDSINISKVVEFSGKLEEIALSNLKLYGECRDITKKVLVALQNYNDISNSIKLLFSQLDTAISNLENALQLRVVSEE